MLTKRQKQILDHITKCIKKNDYAPSLEEIKGHFGLSSVSTIHEHVETLRKNGYLKKAKNQPRSIALYRNRNEQFIQIPLLGAIAAGKPIEAIEDREETIAVPKSKLPRTGEVYALRAQGDSMIDEDIHDGDTILIKKQNVAENGDKVVALLNGNEATLKTFYKENKQIRLQPANKNYQPIIIKNGQEFSLQGVLLDVIGSPSPVAFTKKLPWMK